MSKEYFLAYHSYLKSMEPLNDAECGRLFKACLKYSMTGAAPELRGNERFVFPMIQSQIDRDNKNYRKKCEQNTENINKRYTNVYERIRDGTEPTIEKENEKEKENTNGKGQGQNARADTALRTVTSSFSPPTVEEVDAYCSERKNGVDPQRFFDFYQSKGWMVGKNKMKDWRAAVRTWEKNTTKTQESSSGWGYEGMDEL